MSADAKVFAGCCVIGIFALGIEIGSEARPVICPDKAPHEQLVSITINGPVTVNTLRRGWIRQIQYLGDKWLLATSIPKRTQA